MKPPLPFGAISTTFWLLSTSLFSITNMVPVVGSIAKACGWVRLDTTVVVVAPATPDSIPAAPPAASVPRRVTMDTSSLLVN